jgi:hypothetical protein
MSLINFKNTPSYNRTLTTTVTNNISKVECKKIYNNIKQGIPIKNPRTDRSIVYHSPITKEILKICYTKYKMKQLPNTINSINQFGGKKSSRSSSNTTGVSIKARSLPNAISESSPGATRVSIKARSLSNTISKKTLTTTKDVERWIRYPEKHPITGIKMNPMSSIYENIYETSYKIIKKNIVSTTNEWYYDHFPNKHRLFGTLDFLFHTFVSKDSVQHKEESILCQLLHRGKTNIQPTYNILETELELIRNMFSNKPIQHNGVNNYTIAKIFFEIVKNNMIKNLIEASSSTERPDFKNLTIEYICINSTGFVQYDTGITFIRFMENYKFSNGKVIINYLREIVDISEFKVAVDMYDEFKRLYDDITQLLDPTSGIVDNYDNKEFTIIEDPLKQIFEKYEDKLKQIKSPRFSNLLDLTSFTPVPNNRFLNDKQYKRFQRFKGIMEDMHKKSKQEYEKSLSQYESIKDTTPTAKSPIPPKRPTIKLENGQTYIYGNIEPKHIPDSLVKEFNLELNKAQPFIDDYNRIKDMGYLDLIKHETQRSPTKDSKKLIKKHPLLSMNRKKINENILYDYSGNENKCHGPTDILSNEELDNDNYPLAKLQLMVTLKFQKPNRTECVYAPKLYNLLVTSINNKEAFIDPTTRLKYSDEHINQIMDIIQIIDPNIEIPKFLKPINDTKLLISYEETRSGSTREMGNRKLNWYNISISRTFGDKTHKILDLCTIPADIEVSGSFATESTNLTSNVMLSKILELFNDGKLLHNYVPPYYIIDGGYIKYIKLKINFNRYKVYTDWFYDQETSKPLNKKEFIDMFKRYAEDINNLQQ